MTNRTEPAAIAPSAESIKLLKDLGRQASAPEIINLTVEGEGLPKNIPLGWDRNNQRFIPLRDEVEKWREHPRERSGTAQADTLASFIDLVKRHADKDASVLFGKTTMPDPAITAVLDYHSRGKPPANLRHRVCYAFPLTEEFKAWATFNRKPMEQGDFVRFIEDHAAELVSPFDAERAEFEALFKERFATPSEMITLSRELEVVVGHHVKRSERPKSGERSIVFVEQQTDSNGEAIDIPGVFMIAVQAFTDGDRVRIPARLRFRAGGGSIHWHYDLYRLDHWLRAETVKDLEKAAKETGLPHYEGKPEA